jgi:c-di-GMP-binding flagellar brake protein YcgR
MDLKDNNQFKKVSSEDKFKIFNDLLNYPEEIICKTISSFFQILPAQILNQTKFYFKFVGPEIDILSGEEVVCQFIFKKKDLYLFKSTFIKDRFSVYLSLDPDLFQIQRRDNFRMVFPESINSKVSIKNKMGNVCIGKVYDLSKTGIRVCFKDPIEGIQNDDILDLDIKIIGNDNVKAQAVLRHYNDETELVAGKKITKYYYGFQFHQLSSQNESALSAINMDLYRNFLSKIGS